MTTKMKTVYKVRQLNREMVRFGTYWKALLSLHPFSIVHTLLSFSPTQLGFRKLSAFRSRSTHWMLWAKSRVDLSVLT